MNKKITCPYDIAGHKVGERMTLKKFLIDVDIYVTHLKQELEDLGFELDEKEGQIEDLAREIDNLNTYMDECMRPVSPYYYNGVSPSDF